MTTESEQEYKGYIIKQRYSTLNGATFKIFKPDGINRYNLRQENWNFKLPEEGVQRMKLFIDNYPERLEEKYQRLKSIKQLKQKIV